MVLTTEYNALGNITALSLLEDSLVIPYIIITYIIIIPYIIIGITDDQSVTLVCHPRGFSCHPLYWLRHPYRVLQKRIFHHFSSGDINRTQSKCCLI